MATPVSGIQCRGVGTKAPTIALSSRVLLAIAVALGLVVGFGEKALAESTQGPGERGAAKNTGRWAAERRLENFDPARFSRPAEVSNAWMPLKPGTRLTYEGSSVDDEGEPIKRRMQINVTDLTKTIGGIRAVVSWDLDWSDGELVEAELSFYAQDDSGNVWLMGEYPEEYEDGKLTGNPGWIHGVEGSTAGIAMKAQPKLGGPSYSQGWGPAVGYTDRARADSLGVFTCVPANCYHDVLVIAEGSEEEIDAEQLKYYARGVGNVRVGWRGDGETEKQCRWLTKVEALKTKELAEIREKALALEKSGYANSKQMYARTPPLQKRSSL